MFTRQGASPGVTFPRVLGIEAVGVVASCPGGEFQEGEILGTAMGGMGRIFDGGYAEYTCVPVKQVQAIKTQLPWEILGSLPEMLNTVWGSLFSSLQLKSGDRLLIRGGTTSIGLAATAIAKNHGCFVASTSRKADREASLRANGADDVFVDTGFIASEVRKRYPEGFTKCLELIGITTIRDSLKCVSQNGILCMTGIAGGIWTFDEFTPMNDIPSGVCFTTFADPDSFMKMPLDELAQLVKAGKLKIPIRSYKFEDTAQTHVDMESSRGGAKMVVLVD